MNTQSVDEQTRQAHKVVQVAVRAEKNSSSSSAGQSSEHVGQDERAEDEGSVLVKMHRMVSKPLGYTPSLALDNPGSEDGVLQRPYGNDSEDGREASPDSNDSDSISAYEDASAETPEQDRIFPGDENSLELPDDSMTKEGCLSNDSRESQNPKTPESCVVS